MIAARLSVVLYNTTILLLIIFTHIRLVRRGDGGRGGDGGGGGNGGPGRSGTGNQNGGDGGDG